MNIVIGNPRHVPSADVINNFAIRGARYFDRIRLSSAEDVAFHLVDEQNAPDLIGWIRSQKIEEGRIEWADFESEGTLTIRLRRAPLGDSAQNSSDQTDFWRTLRVQDLLRDVTPDVPWRNREKAAARAATLMEELERLMPPPDRDR